MCIPACKTSITLPETENSLEHSSNYVQRIVCSASNFPTTVLSEVSARFVWLPGLTDFCPLARTSHLGNSLPRNRQTWKWKTSLGYHRKSVYCICQGETPPHHFFNLLVLTQSTNPTNRSTTLFTSFTIPPFSSPKPQFYSSTSEPLTPCAAPALFYTSSSGPTSHSISSLLSAKLSNAYPCEKHGYPSYPATASTR